MAWNKDLIYYSQACWPTPVISALGRRGSQEFKDSLGLKASLRPVYITQNPVSKRPDLQQIKNGFPEEAMITLKIIWQGGKKNDC